uniref:PyrK1 n=1 Tax=Streptomyces rugosporus TaxID=295838 RepID=K7QQB8_STRRG|nr:PyrK1 [Streptomyces rugosporus]
MPQTTTLDLPLDELEPELVTVLDPLAFDEVARRMPAMNAAGDVNGLVDALRTRVPEETGDYTLPERLAAMRDLGMLLGSVKRHGVEPAQAVPEVVPVLEELGRATGLIARDTVLHYSIWNPRDGRRRMYTGDDQEHCMQNVLRTVLPELRQALALCDLLVEIDPRDSAFAADATALARHMDVMADLMDLIVRRVSPAFFAHDLRPYYEEVTIAGEVLMGPAAAHVPLWLADLAIWASDQGDEDYAEFLGETVPYTLPRWRDFYLSWLPGPSMVTRLAHAYERNGDSPTLRRSAAALVRLLRAITVFRGRHLRIARQAYAESMRLYPAGSAGGTIELLDSILALTRQASDTVRQSSGFTATRRRRAAEGR